MHLVLPKYKSMNTAARPLLHRMARAGLTAKGIVYVLLGALAFLAAFEIGGQRNRDASRGGVFRMIMDWPAGKWLLVLLAAGLVCYSAWRFIEAFSPHSSAHKKWLKRGRYLFSGLAYLSVAITALTLVFKNKSSDSDQNQQMAATLLNQPLGEWITAIAAIIISIIGIYQLWYGFSEKYKKHVQEQDIHQHAHLLLFSGKAGYMARGIVWLVIAYFLLQAALHSRATDAGDTTKAFSFIESMKAGSVLLGLIGLGFVAYGIFNFIRARYERL